MVTTISPSAMRSPPDTSHLRVGWCRTSRKRSSDLRGNEAIQSYAKLIRSDCFAALHSHWRFSSPVEDNTGDDEHCRHRQRLRERFRGRPFGGFLHVQLPRLDSLDLGMAHRRAKHAHTTANDFYSEHPATSIRSDESPLSEYRQSQNRPALRRQFGPRAAGLCAREGVFWEQWLAANGP